MWQENLQFILLVIKMKFLFLVRASTNENKAKWSGSCQQRSVLPDLWSLPWRNEERHPRYVSGGLDWLTIYLYVLDTCN